MDNFDLKSYLSNNPLLTEIKVTSPGAALLFPEKYLDDLNNMTEGYLEGSSPEDILDPLGEIYDLDRFEDYEDDDSQLIAFQNIINNLPPQTYIIKNWLGLDPAPGAPSNSFDTLIKITPDKFINVLTPAMSNDGENAGWFDSKGNYYPDLEHFTEDGDRLD